MKKVTFNVPDNIEVMHVICVSRYPMGNGMTGANLNAQFYDLRADRIHAGYQAVGWNNGNRGDPEHETGGQRCRNYIRDSVSFSRWDAGRR